MDTDRTLPRAPLGARGFGWHVQRALRKGLLHLLIAAVIIVFIFPIWVGVDTSIKPANQLRKFPTSVLTTSPTLEKYAQALGPLKLYRYMGNTVIVAGATTLLGLLVGSPAAYALSRFRFTGRGFFARTVLLIYMFPPMLLIIPLYLMMTAVKVRDSLFSLIVTDTTFALPFSIWMLKAFFDTVPRDLDDAALIDGCTPLSVLHRVLLPVSGPGVVATAVFCFMLGWGEYLFAVTFITTQSLQPITVAVYALISPFAVDPSLLMATSVISAIPPVIFFFAAQKWIVQGLMAGATGAPRLRVSVQPPESGIIGGGLVVLLLPRRDLAVDAETEAPRAQHLDHVGRSLQQVGMDRDQDRRVLVSAGLVRRPALVAVRRLLQPHQVQEQRRFIRAPLVAKPGLALRIRAVEIRVQRRAVARIDDVDMLFEAVALDLGRVALLARPNYRNS